MDGLYVGRLMYLYAYVPVVVDFWHKIKLLDLLRMKIYGEVANY